MKRENPFYYLKWLSGLFLFLSLAAMVCAGLLFTDMRQTEARLLAETREAMLADGGLPQGVHFALSVVCSIGLALVGGIVFTFAAVAEGMLRSR